MREQFDKYISLYHNDFSRSDQREWFRLYVWGLLTAPKRKNVGSIASLSSFKKFGINLSQALQHFITDSPWDFQRVIARYREIVAPTYRTLATTWVISDCTLLKKGKNSVGTQRQYARSLGKKVNCQLAVFVGLNSRRGYLPLSTQLYLPGHWLREHPTLAARTVPSEHRRYRSKMEIATQLVEELLKEGWNADNAALDEGFRADDEFPVRETRFADSADQSLLAAHERLEWLKERLGLDHFEGRTWIGWHHHLAMIFAAAGFLFTSHPELLS